MTKTRALQVRLTIVEHEQLKSLARRQGFASLAAYLRHMGLAQDFLLHDQVAALHRHLLGPTKPKKRRGAPPTGEAPVAASSPDEH
jgi:hypothetical protein